MKDSDPRYVIYARGLRPCDDHSRMYIPVMRDPAYAKAWLTFFLDGEETVRDGNTILFPSDPELRLKSDQLDRILGTNEPAELSDLDERRILRFKHGYWDQRPAKADKPVDGTKRSAEVVRERRAERPTGYVTITELCSASGMLPMIARAALRASGREKPAYGWAFDPKEVPAIKALCGMS